MAILQNKDKATKDGRSWYYTYSYIDENGNKKRTASKMFKTKEEAKREEAVYLLNKNRSIANKKFDTVAQAYFKELEINRKRSTYYTYLKNYNKHLRDFYGEMNIYTIDVSIVRIWASKCLNLGLSVNYCNRLHTLLQNIFDFAIKNYKLQSNPAKIYGRFQNNNDTVKEDKDKLRYITFDEFQQFINVVDNPLYHCLFVFAYYTGCRKGEMLALSWNDIDFNLGIINISKTLHQEVKGNIYISSNKTNTNRKVKMSKTLRDELLSYKEFVKQYADFKESWYVFGNSMYLPTTTIDRYKKMYFNKSEVHEITMHEFRHSHVSLLINEYIKNGGTDMAKLFLTMSDRMGHSIEVMQKTYMHLLPSVQDEIVDILDNL